MSYSARVLGLKNPMQIDTFLPEKRTLGQILSSTSPPIRVPDYQRDYSWEKEQVGEFWADLVAFGGNAPHSSLVGKEYFLGAAVLVNNGSFHLLLDGQQRLATATILLAALRDKISEFKADAAKQLQDQYITFEDHLTGARVFKIELNIFDRAFFRDFIQCSPRVAVTPAKKSHQAIKNAYELFRQKLDEGWDLAGGGKKGFEWAAHITLTLREHMALVTVVSNNDKSAASIFATLNDRGIGLSTVDLIRSFVLQSAHATQRDEILQCWDAMFNSCGPNTLAAETLIRMSWVSQHGDVKTRALYKIVVEELEGGVSPLDYSRRLRDDAALYRQFREGDHDDSEVQEDLIALRTLKFNGGYPLLLAAHHILPPEERLVLIRALVSVVVRHNVVCDLDRAKLESTAYAGAKILSDGGSLDAVLAVLRAVSPNDQQFSGSFAKLSFSRAEHSVARYLLRCFDSKISTTEEVTIAGADRVHVEHIYPQTPVASDRWPEHDRYCKRLGNLTLLDRRLNEQIKNSNFATKKEKAYSGSRLEITKALLKYDDWSPQLIDERQSTFCELATSLWPVDLV